MDEGLEDQMGWKRAQRRLIILLRCLLGRGMVEGWGTSKGTSSGITCSLTQSHMWAYIYTPDTYGVPTSLVGTEPYLGAEIAKVSFLQA